MRISDWSSDVCSSDLLHVLRYKRDGLDALIDAINATGYGLTFGVHTRLDETVARVTERIQAGNVYVNRNIVGAVVGVQPLDRKSVVEGKSVSVRVDLGGGRRIIKKIK